MQATYPLEAVPAALAKAAAGGMVSKIGITTDKLPPPQQHHQQRQQQQSLASRLPTKTDDTTTRAPPPPPQSGPIPQAQPAKFFEQKLDHFNAESGTWTQRYYLDDRAWSGAAKLGPLLFIPGGEWSVTPSKGLLYGLVRELAVELGGMAMIAEHRFCTPGSPPVVDVFADPRLSRPVALRRFLLRLALSSLEAGPLF